MAFEKYKPRTHSSEPRVRLKKYYLSFNIPAAKLLKWDRVNIAVDKLKGEIALSEAPQDEGLTVHRNKKCGHVEISTLGLVKCFDLARLLNFEFRIEVKKDLIMLFPKQKKEL